MEKYGFGVDVGGTSCKLGLFTDSGKLMEKWEIPSRTENEGKAIGSFIMASVEWELMKR